MSVRCLESKKKMSKGGRCGYIEKNLLGMEVLDRDISGPKLGELVGLKNGVRS